MSAVTVEDIVSQINDHITELDGRATPEATFEDLEVDSLVCVEIAVLLSHRYDVEIAEDEVAEAGGFTGLVNLVRDRVSSRVA